MTPWAGLSRPKASIYDDTIKLAITRLAVAYAFVLTFAGMR